MNLKNKTKKTTKKTEQKEIMCGSCGKTKKNIDFYTSYNKIHTSGRIPYCKSCLKNMILDINGEIDIDKVKNTLKLIDKPFFPDLWESSYKEDGDTFGIYMKNTAMTQYRNYTWDNSEKNENTNNTYSQTIEKKKEDLIYSSDWVGYYTQSDLDYLEEYLKSLKDDFKIVTRNHKDYARKIAKASLAMDKAYEEMIAGNGGEKKYKDMKEIFDTLSKSAQFSESERGINDVSLGCFGVVFDKVEKKVWIPEHQPEDKDTYDLLLEQFSNINKSL